MVSGGGGTISKQQLAGRQNLNRNQTSSGSKTNLPDGSLGGLKSSSRNQQQQQQSDDENRMHLDQQQTDIGANDSVVKMEMSPTSDVESKSAAMANRLASEQVEQEDQQIAITSIESSPNHQQHKQLEQHQTQGLSNENRAEGEQVAGVNNVDGGPIEQPTVMMSRNSSFCEKSNANGEQKVGGTGNESGNGSQHDDQLVRQMSSSRENSKKSQQSRQDVTSGGAGAGNDGCGHNQRQQPPSGSGEGHQQSGSNSGGAGGEDHYTIQRLSKQQDQQAATNQQLQRDQQASQPKQIIESSVPVDRRCRLCWCCCCPCSA